MRDAGASPRAAPIIVASKPFGESYLLAEMFAQTLEAHGIAVDRKPGLGQTQIAIEALRSGAIDVYPEYTGTGLLAVLHDTLSDSLASDARLVYAHVAREFASRYGMRWLPPLGFQNSYAIAVRTNTAAQYHLRTLSDLAREAVISPLDSRRTSSAAPMVSRGSRACTAFAPAPCGHWRRR